MNTQGKPAKRGQTAFDGQSALQNLRRRVDKITATIKSITKEIETTFTMQAASFPLQRMPLELRQLVYNFYLEEWNRDFLIRESVQDPNWRCAGYLEGGYRPVACKTHKDRFINVRGNSNPNEEPKPTGRAAVTMPLLQTPLRWEVMTHYINTQLVFELNAYEQFYRWAMRNVSGGVSELRKIKITIGYDVVRENSTSYSHYGSPFLLEIKPNQKELELRSKLRLSETQRVGLEQTLFLMKSRSSNEKNFDGNFLMLYLEAMWGLKKYKFGFNTFTFGISEADVFNGANDVKSHGEFWSVYRTKEKDLPYKHVVCSAII